MKMLNLMKKWARGFAFLLAATVTTGLFAADDVPYLAENLSVWLRADKGLSTDSFGAVTSWANQGTLGAAVNVAPHADNSAGHVKYEETGINGKPSLLFDGSVYLKTADATNLGITQEGGAWFVVYKTPCTRTERANMAIMGSNYNNGGIRFGSFFANNGNEQCFNYFFGDVGATTVTSNATEIACSMLWKEDNTAYGYSMIGNTAGSRRSLNYQPYSAVFMVGNLIPLWMPTFKGEIAEIRIYNRALTWRERSRIQFELCARYGVYWAAHGGINGNALQWYGESSQFGHWQDQGVPEGLVSSVSSGGAVLTLGTPSTAENTCSYFSNNGGGGVSRMWYVSTYFAVKNGSSATFTFDRSKIHIGSNPSLYYKGAYDGAWTKMDIAAVETSSAVSFTLPKGGWDNGFYTVHGDLDHNLSVWLRADKGLSTDSFGAVTSWANQGTLSAAVNVAPHADNSAGHVKYEETGINGKPSLLFDGSVYLKTADATNLGITQEGGAWFVVYKTPCTRTERANMAIMGSNNNNGGIRFGAFFANNGNEECQNFFFGQHNYTTVAANTTEVASSMLWKESSKAYGYSMSGGYGVSHTERSYQPYSAEFMVGHIQPSANWVKIFKGEIAEIRVYNRPLTGRERMTVQFELFARYGVSYPSIDDNGLSWHENGAMFGYYNDGLPESIPVSAVSGGATLAFGETPSATDYTRCYFTNNGIEGVGRVWYVFASSAACALPMTFTVDANVVGGTGRLILRHSNSSEGPWTRVGVCDAAVGGQYQFSFDRNGLSSGFYKVEKANGLIIIIK